MNPQSTNIDTLRQSAPSTAMVAATQGEIAASAIAAQARATVMARYEMAIRNPRDWDRVRQDLMKECRRPSFANNKSAFYKKPIGDGVEGLGIRFVEVALRCMRNVLIETQLVFEDDMKEVIRVTVTDIESNNTWPGDVKVSKTVERSRAAEGAYLSVRKNSYGKDVFTILATDDDLLNKRAALVSKMVRTLGLRLIPGDMQDEAEKIIKDVRKDEAARDPDAARKAMVDAFEEIGVSVDMIVKYLGHPLSETSPAEIVDLRGYYAAIKDDETTWHAIMEARGERKPPATDGKQPADKKPEPPAEAKKEDGAGGAPAGATSTADLRKGREPTQQQAQAEKPQQTVLPVFTESGRQLTQLTYVPTPGEIIEADGLNYRVIDVYKDKVVVKAADAVRTAPNPAGAKAAESQAQVEDVELTDVLNAIKAAKTQDEVIEAEKLIPELPEDERSAATGSAKRRKQVLATEAPPAAEAKAETKPAAAAKGKRSGVE